MAANQAQGASLPQLKIAVFGAGGVGGYYGALLAQSGQHVALVARGQHLQAIRENGLRVESVHGDFSVRPAQATDRPEAIGPVDLVLVTVKTYDLEAAAEAMHPLLSSQTMVLPLLNGLEATDVLAAALGAEHVLPGLTHVSSSVVAPGVIRQVSPLQRITFGETDGTITPRAQGLRKVLADANIDVVLSQSVEEALWEKFVFIAAISGVCCLARLPMGPVLHTPETRELYRDALEEVAAVGRAHDVKLPPEIVQSTLRLSASFAPDTKPSLLVALESGQQLELEAMSGAVVRYGQAVGLSTPVHRIVYAALKPSARGAVP
jgi:2-dehydropantoate 2-reductase